MAYRVHKQKRAGFGNVKERRILRAVENNEIRRHRRSAIFTANRPIEERITPSTSSVENQQVQPPDSQDIRKEDRMTKLKKWKAEKELQKKMQKKLTQSVFQAGIYHHKPNSPVFLHQCKPANKPSKPPTPRITKATAKRIAAKKNVSGQDKVQTKVIKADKNTESLSKSKILNGRSVANDHQSKSSDDTSTLDLNDRETLDENINQKNVLPICFSPYVVSARGKRASRKEQQHNLEIGEHTFTETKSDETDVHSEGKSDHEEEMTTSCFKIMVKKEVNRLKTLCQHWTIVQTDDSISEDSQQLINQAIGQTNLFINKKVEQFKQLIADCEFGTGEKLVTCQDLQGFWDMMYMQVEDCDSRFDKLKKLQERNWKEEKKTRVRKAVVVAAKKPTPTKKIVSKSSSIRDAIRAARKKHMESQQTEHTQDTIIRESSGEASANYLRLPAVNFDGGFFVVQSPKKIITPRSVRKSSLAQQPELSNITERRRSALILMNVSQKLKPPEIKPVEVEWDPTIEYVNYQQTPGRSILKRIDGVESVTCSKKSQNKVIFSKNHQNAMNKNILGINEQFSAISDSEDNHEEYEIPFDAKRQLNLSDLESDMEETENQESTHINKNFMQKENLPPNNSEIPKRRRSTRKSVKIAGGDCTACSVAVTPQPTTPRGRRRQSKLMDTPNKDELSTKNKKPQTPTTQDMSDLISWDTPKDPPPILRRSLRLKNCKT